MNYMEWFSLGLALVLLEVFVPGVYLVWFGLSAFATGILTIYYDFGAIEQSVVFGIFPSSSPLPAGLFTLRSSNAAPAPKSTNTLTTWRASISAKPICWQKTPRTAVPRQLSAIRYGSLNVKTV